MRDKTIASECLLVMSKYSKMRNIFQDENVKILECDCHKHACAKCLKLTNAQYTTTPREGCFISFAEVQH